MVNFNFETLFGGYRAHHPKLKISLFFDFYIKFSYQTISTEGHILTQEMLFRISTTDGW